MPIPGLRRRAHVPLATLHHILDRRLVSLRVRGPMEWLGGHAAASEPQGFKALLCHLLPHDPVSQLPHLYRGTRMSTSRGNTD